MTQLQGFGALLFGAVALAFIGVLSLGDPLASTLALLAMFAAYLCQWCLFLSAANSGIETLEKGAFYLQVLTILLGLASFLLSVWL